MDKKSFISEIKPILKKWGYRKNGNYWYKTIDCHICCINVQGSQWDKDMYYVNIGFASTSSQNPTILQWQCRHRCKGTEGEVNLLPEELIKCMQESFDKVTETKQISAFLESHAAVKVASQFYF